jgi:hypothetical protein
MLVLITIVHLLGVINGVEVKVKVKVQFTLEQAMKTQRWSRGITLHFL